MASRDDRPLVYLVGAFPQASQAFIAREIRGLIAAGVGLQVYALRRRSPKALEAADREWFARVHFAPRAYALTTLRANVELFRRDPRRYARAFLRLAGLSHRPRMLCLRVVPLFAVAAWIARAIEQSGGCRRLHAHFALAQTEVAMAVDALIGCGFSFTAHARDIYATPSALGEKIRAANLVVTCTAYNAGHLRALCPELPPSRIQLVHHGVDVDALARVGRAPDSPPLLAAAGRLVEKKGFEVLVAACGILRDRGLQFQCVIAGTGPQARRLQRAIQRENLDHVVTLPGWLSPDELWNLMARASAFVVPSLIARGGDRDGIPNVVLEAMGLGVPVIASAVSGIPEAVEDGRTGLLVQPGTPDVLAAALERLFADPDRVRVLGHAAQRRVAEVFELHGSTRRLTTILDGEPRVPAAPR